MELIECRFVFIFQLNFKWKLTKKHIIVSYSTTDADTCREGQIITTTFPNNIDYLYYKIMVYDVPGRTNGNKYVVLRDIKMFGSLTGNQF